jgi:hypothetical protein
MLSEVHLASVFGIAYLNIALFDMALRQFCLHVLHMWKDNDQVDARLRQRPSGCSTTTKWMLALLCPSLPQGLCVSKTMLACLASFLGVSPFRETQDPMVDARLDFLYRYARAMEKLNEVNDIVTTKS